ncbi:hypothetical protein ACN38_g6980 [Penicillium nordicum]|uniref:Uncharacterized protein n=1 Tax=Penicillium nordicum TaxID=229535 RepID=A0A0M8P7S5_9EURO|nr:hypothetical protein ACN38_g6980 [Penicillium nordicum]
MNFPLLVTWSIATIYHDVIDCLIPIIEVLIEHWNQLIAINPELSPKGNQPLRGEDGRIFCLFLLLYMEYVVFSQQNP